MSDQDVKTEQPTEKRLQDAFEEGQFARAPDLQVVAILVAAFFVLSFGVREYSERIASIAVGIFSQLGKNPLAVDGVTEWTGFAARTMLGLVLPIGLACSGAAALAGGLQSQFRLTPKALGFKASRLDPLAGLQRLFSKQGWVKLASDSVKFLIVGLSIWGAVQAILRDPIFFTPVPTHRLGNFILDSTLLLLTRFILALGAIAAVNYVLQLRKTREDLMMSRHEVKEEQKQSEGDPKIKALMRQMARRFSQKQMLKSVQTADVVITNPTHYAVALKYERGKDQAPMVLAKGEGGFARRIKALAAEHDVPMVENKPVARLLFKAGKVGKPIPFELYQAVADILAFVYKTHRYYFHQLKARRAEG